MRLEKQEEPLIFSKTSIPDVFFTEYFSEATGNSVKVYLYLLFLSKYNKDINLNDLSKKLELDLPSVRDSLSFWESKNVIIRKGNGYELLDLQKLELDKLYKPKISISSEDMKKTAKNQKRAKAIESINNSFFQGVMSPSWYGDIDMWFSKYGFDEEVMFSLFSYCFNKSALHRNYVEAVASGWYKDHIKTGTDLEKYFQKLEELNKSCKIISKKLGISRNLTEYEIAYIEKWTVNFGYKIDIIELALKKTTSKSNPSFDYIDKLLSDWHDKKLKTVNDVNNYIEKMKEKTNFVKEYDKKKSFNDYNQRQHKDLSNLYINKKPSK